MALAGMKGSLNPLAVGVSIQPVADLLSVLALKRLNPLAVGVGIQPILNCMNVVQPTCLNPLAVGVGIQHEKALGCRLADKSQSPRGRGRYSTGNSQA